MATVTQCDRCNAIYRREDGLDFLDCGEGFRRMRLEGRHKVLKELDLCNDCLQKFLNWLGPEIEE